MTLASTRLWRAGELFDDLEVPLLRRNRKWTAASAPRREQELAACATAHNRLLGTCCLLMGSLSLAVLLGFLVLAKPWNWSPLFGAHRTTGQVVSLELIDHGAGDEMGGGGGAFHPRVRYEVAGKSYEIGGMAGMGYQIGDAVPVAYPRMTPHTGSSTDSLKRLRLYWSSGGVDRCLWSLASSSCDPAEMGRASTKPSATGMRSGDRSGSKGSDGSIRCRLAPAWMPSQIAAASPPLQLRYNMRGCNECRGCEALCWLRALHF